MWLSDPAFHHHTQLETAFATTRHPASSSKSRPSRNCRASLKRRPHRQRIRRSRRRGNATLLGKHTANEDGRKIELELSLDTIVMMWRECPIFNFGVMQPASDSGIPESGDRTLVRWYRVLG